MSWFSTRARLLSPIGWAAAGVVALLLVMALWWVLASHQRHKREEAQDKAGTALAASHAASAHDAVETTVQASIRDAQTDHTTQENRDAIRNASGANAPVDPVLSRAGLDGLCRRAAYRGRPECVQHAGSIEP